MLVISEQTRQRLIQALQALEFLADGTGAIEPGRQEGVAAAAGILLRELQRHQPDPEAADPRILRVAGRARLVAPARRVSDRGVYYNGRLLVETQHADSLGMPVWRTAQELEWPVAASKAGGIEALIVLLLAGHRFDDRELSQWQKA